MTVDRLDDGLWRWTAPHPEWNGASDWPEVVGSVYCETNEAVVLVDPLVPADLHDGERFWRALDRDVERLGRPVVVLVTCRWHVRSAQDLRERYGATVWAPERTGHGFADVVTDVIRDEEELLPGVVALDTGFGPPNEECVYVLTGFRTAVAGDVLIGDETGGLRLADPDWYANSDEEREHYRERLGPALARLERYRVERLLLGHGAPVVDASTPLREVLLAHMSQ